MEFLQKEVPSNAGDLISSLNLCIENIDNIRELLRNKAIELQNYDEQSKLDESMKCTNANKMLLDLRDYLKGYINFTDEEMLYDNDEEAGEKNENSTEEKDNDKKYLTDQTIPCPLSEKLANTKPCKFSFRKIPHDVSSYKVLWVKVCEILYEKDNKRFENIAKMKKLSGRGIPYITYKNDEAVKDIKDVDKRFAPFLDTNILVYTNMNIPQIIKIIEELLGIYKISSSSIKVYLKNDKNPKYGHYPVGKYLDDSFDYEAIINQKQNKKEQIVIQDKPEISISQRAYDYFQEYFKNINKVYDIQNFLNKEWCYKTFNVSYPVFKQVDNTLPLKEQTYTDDKNYAHYAQGKQVVINGISFMIYMRWNNKHRDKLEKWISENPITEPIETQQKRNKSNCIYYDFKKDLCGHVKNLLFNQPCTSFVSCKYYSEKEAFVVQDLKNKICPYCGSKSNFDYLEVTYTKNGSESSSISHQLHGLKCESCGKFFMKYNLYKNYIKNKNLDDLNVKFTKFEK